MSISTVILIKQENSLEKGDRMVAICELCGREGVELTIHHLLPKELGGTFGETAKLCIPCHKQIHALYTNSEIAARLSTLSDLRADPAIKRFIKWIRNQPSSKLVRNKKVNRKKRINEF